MVYPYAREGNGLSICIGKVMVCPSVREGNGLSTCIGR